jgi:ergothioneine biosynthesis protein EgtB
LIERYWRIRQQSEALCKPLLIEDYNLQAMAEVSPPKWHLAHTTWFFEALLLKEFVAGYQIYHPHYDMLFNSYYLSLGNPYPRARRGLLSRPTVADVLQYRSSIDQQIIALLEQGSIVNEHQFLQRLELGLNHEQQHQELLLTDTKYNLFSNPLQPIFRQSTTASADAACEKQPIRWIEFASRIAYIGADSGDSFGFFFDNETPRHRVFLQGYALADRPANCGDYLAFMQDGGYLRPELWLADGWQKKVQEGWCAPLYWQQADSEWQLYTLHGTRPLNYAEPVFHISYYEADAFARWAAARLPTEMEWESAAASQPVDGHFLRDGIDECVLHPLPPAQDRAGLRQLYGDVWEWTASAYAPYPGYTPPPGAVGEYNGKFMCNQLVLRGGSCVSERNHLRPSYRNFFYPWDRWQFSGVRLAKSIE